MQYGIKNGGLSEATVGLPTAGWGQPNPANPGYQETGVVSFFAVQAYGLKELRPGGIHAVLPLRSSTLMLQAFTIGFDTYRETQVQAGLAVPFPVGSSRQFLMAIQGTVKHLSINSYGSANGYGLTLGASMNLTHNLYFGAAALHFFQTNGVVPLPKTLGLGVAYHPLSAGWVMASIVQQLAFAPSVNLAFEIQPAPFLFLRYGFSTAPVKYALGAGILAGSLGFDLAAAYHQRLGWTPGVAINLTFMRRKAAP